MKPFEMQDLTGVNGLIAIFGLREIHMHQQRITILRDHLVYQPRSLSSEVKVSPMTLIKVSRSWKPFDYI